MKIEARYASRLEQNGRAHERAAERLAVLETSGVTPGETLGDSARRDFLAMADHQVDAAHLGADEIKERVRHLYQGAQVLFASKRQAVVRVGELVAHCNRFGVCTFLLSLDFLSGRWGSLRSAPSFDCSLPNAIGAVVEGRDRGDHIYNYSGCRS